MFDKCIPCPRIGESCVPNLMLLPFSELMQWCNKRQKYLGWSNQQLADHPRCKIPVGTINRIKAGEEDCKYSTMRSILIALIGGTTDEFACSEQVEQLERQAAMMSSVQIENEELKRRIEEYREQNDFLRKENDRKAKIIDKFLE